MQDFVDAVGGWKLVGGGAGVIALIYVLSRIFAKPATIAAQTQKRKCPECDWFGSVTKQKPRCPKCNHAF